MICVHQSWFIWYQQLPSLLLVHHACYSLFYRLEQSVPNIPVSFCYIILIQPWLPNRLFQSDTVSSEQSVGDNSVIQLWYHTCIRPEDATGCNRSVAFLRVYNSQFDVQYCMWSTVLYMYLQQQIIWIVPSTKDPICQKDNRSMYCSVNRQSAQFSELIIL